MMRLAKVLGGLIILAVAIVALWVATYPDQHDPKNLRYVLWKHGLVSMDLDVAVYNIEEDVQGKSDLILGKSKQQISRKFGFLLTPHQAGPVLESCVKDVQWAEGKDAMYLRHSDILVVFDHGVATDVNVVKPC